MIKLKERRFEIFFKSLLGIAVIFQLVGLLCDVVFNINSSLSLLIPIGILLTILLIPISFVKSKIKYIIGIRFFLISIIIMCVIGFFVMVIDTMAIAIEIGRNITRLKCPKMPDKLSSSLKYFRLITYNLLLNTFHHS